MCGRYRLTRRRQLEIEQYYGVEEVRDLDLWERQFNIPPTEMAPIVMEAHGHRRLTAALWSLMPPWADTLEQVNQVSTFNAMASKPTFRNAFLKRRCIVPAEAFYEWVGPKGKKQPLSISRRDGKFLSMAGLFSYWKPRESQGKPIPTFTVVTTIPSRWMARIHNRMPVILQDEQLDGWLDSATEAGTLSRFLKPCPEEFPEFYPVEAKLVSSGRIDVPECADKIDVDVQPLLKAAMPAQLSGDLFPD